MMNNKFCYENHDWEKIENSALMTLKESSLHSFPISISPLLSENNVALRKYSSIARQRNMSVKELCDNLTTSDGLLLSKVNSKCNDIIAYNDTIASKPRIGFTLSHELGHKKLGHNNLASEPLTSLPENEYVFLEQEANFFAKNILAPLPCLYYIEQQTHRDLTANDIEFIFDVSKTASNNILNNYQKLSFPIKDEFLIYKFQKSLNWWISILNMIHKFNTAI